MATARLVGRLLVGAALATLGSFVVPVPTQTPQSLQVTEVTAMTGQSQRAPAQAPAQPVAALTEALRELNRPTRGNGGPDKHKNRNGGELAHRKWRKQRSKGRR